MTSIFQRAITRKDLTSVSACGVFPKVDMNINVEVNIPPIFQRAITRKDLTSVSACGVFPKVDMNINVQVNIPPSTSRYQLKWIL